MEFAVIGGDARFAYLTKLLCAEGWDARAVGGMTEGLPAIPWADESELSGARNVVMNWPVPGGRELLAKLAPGTRVFLCGPGAPENVPDGPVYIDLWKDERLQTENAWLTAEGAVAAAMNAGARAMRGSHCLVIGWGRIGRALTELLVGIDAKVTVASRSPRGRNCAIARGASAVPTEEMEEILPSCGMIFSTPPARVLGAGQLCRVALETLIVDVASAPYGVDFEAARRYGLRAWVEPKLPGRYCPYSAAQALIKAIGRAEGAMGNG